MAAAGAAVVPLSFGQQRMWFLNQLDVTSAAYNIPLALRLTGDLNVAALEAALGDVAGLHESLRTVSRHGRHPRQQILDGPAGRPGLAVREAAHGDLTGLLAEEASRGLTCALNCPGGRRCGRSPRPSTCCQSSCITSPVMAGRWGCWPAIWAPRMPPGARVRRPARAPLAVHYADYAIWQRGVLGSADDPDSPAAVQLAYWQQALAGIPEETPLPADRPRPATPSHRGGLVSIRSAPRSTLG